MKTCSKSLITRKIQIKTMMRYHITLIRLAIILRNLQIKSSGEVEEKRKLFYTVGGNVNWCSHYVEQCGGSFLKKLKIEIPCDPAAPFLGIYTEATLIQKDTCAPMFTAALLVIAKTWKQPKCLSTNKRVMKKWHIHAMKHYSAIERMKQCHVQNHRWI